MKSLFGIFQRRKSAYWGYVTACLILFAITFALLGLVLGSSFLRSLNDSKSEYISAQAERALESLKEQETSMHELSLKLSVQDVFRRSFIMEQPYNRIVVADALRLYASYCAIVKSFALVYPADEGSYIVLLSSGTTTDWDFFLRRYGIVEAEDRLRFEQLLQDTKNSQQTMQVSQTLFFSHPVHNISSSGQDDCGFLLFPLEKDDCTRWVSRICALQPELYALDYRDYHLTDASAKSARKVSAGDSSSWHIEVSVLSVSLLSLLDSPKSLLSFCGCIILLIVLVFLLAWQCYRPLRELTKEYSGNLSGESPENEFSQLRNMFTQFQKKNETLMETVEARDMELRDYTLLMLLNNSDAPGLSKELSRIGIQFPHARFVILMIAPVSAKEISSEDISTLIRNIPDLSGDRDVLCAVECDRETHALAIICNLSEELQLAEIILQLNVFLNHFPVRFQIVDGPITGRAEISASYLAAQSKLKLVTSAQPSQNPDSFRHDSVLQQTADKLFLQIQYGDSAKALELLQEYMSLARKQGSALADRYTMMLLISGVYRLCTELNYSLTELQISMMLPSRSLQTIERELSALIPELCSQVQQNRQIIVPTEQLVMQYLKNHFYDYDISAQSISDALGIGINRTYAIIREQTGHSLKTMLTKMRVQYAKQLLGDCSLSMADVAQRVGYSSSSYFSKVFKAATNQSPDAFRRAILSNSLVQEDISDMEDLQS